MRKESGWRINLFADFFKTRDLGFPLAVFVCMRVWTIVAAIGSLQWLPLTANNTRYYYGMPPLDSLPLGWLWSPSQRQDTIWYTAIATRGYVSNDLSAAFFPLYPLTIRALTLIFPINSVAAGLMVSSAAALGAFVLFYRLVYKEAGQDIARRALIYLAVFPTAFFLFAAYTESLFLLLVLAAWWCARTSRWGWAGVCGGLVALARAQGVLIALPLAAIFWRQWRTGKIALHSVFNLGAPVIAFGIFLVYLSQITGSFAAWFSIEGLWRQSALPWDPLIESGRVILFSGDIALVFLNLMDLAITLLFLVGLYAQVRAHRWAEAIYMAIILFPPLFAIARFVADAPLASMLRFLVVAFPGFAWLGALRLSKPIANGIAMVSLMFQTLLLFLFTHWIFVG